MRPRRSIPCLALVLLTAAAHSQPRADGEFQQPPQPAAPDAQPGLKVAAQGILRLAGGDRLVLVSPAGEVRTLGAALGSDGKPQERLESTPRGALKLPDPARTLMALGSYRVPAKGEAGSGPGMDAPTEAQLLFTLGPAGLTVYPLEPGGEFSTQGERLARRAVFGLRLGAPRFAPFLTDVNADGAIDCVVPAADHVSLWLQRPTAEGQPAFELAGDVAVEVSEGADFDGEDLSSRLSMAFSIPGLETEDLNGDGRPDLLVRQGQVRSFHMQRQDGSYPKAPDISVDLAIFKDPESGEFELKPGAALTLGDEAQFTGAELDGDGIVDHVISQGRKLWVFRGTQAGPQFTEPSTVLKSAEPITRVLVGRMDDDALRDLLLLRVQVPSIPTLVLGLFSSWDIELRASAYRNLGEGRFETRPFKSGELTFRLPPILELVRDPFGLVERFRAAGSRFRQSVSGDFDGDGRADTLLLNEERNRLDFYRGRGPNAGRFSVEDFDATLREELFEAKERVWDVDRLLAFLGGLAAEQQRRLTEGQTPLSQIPLDPAGSGLPGGVQLVEVLALDLDGDGRDSAIAVWTPMGDLGDRSYRLLDLALPR